MDQVPATPEALLRQARARIEPNEALVLLAHVLERTPAWLYAHGGDTVAGADVRRFQALVERRMAGEPVAYLTGRRGFWTLDLAVTPDTLIPRPETELLVECALERVPDGVRVELLDLGTGSGAIALALARERPAAQVTATDRSAGALEVARRNALGHGIGNVRFVQGDWFQPVAGQRFDLIASNPPYVAAGDAHLARGDLRFEPTVALASGGDGLDALRAIAAEVRRLDADVIAFQEVENVAIARRVFRGYDICMTGGEGAQHAGFAFRPRRGIRCEPPLESVAAGRGRAGQPLLLHTGDGPPLHLLSVHLKSGCSRDALDSGTSACVLLAAQAQALGEWIAARAEAQERFVVLGDLNRAGAPDAEDPFWQMLDASRFDAAASHLPFRNCVFDHILVDRALLPQLHAEGFAQMRFHAAKSTRYRLPDHCPVRVSLSLAQVV